MSDNTAIPEISVIILNYNGRQWIDRCLESIVTQTTFGKVEVIFADNCSTDGSDALAQRKMQSWTNGRFMQNNANLGFCEGNNRAARTAAGEFLLFLNNDTWLEPDCLERLLDEVRVHGADAATPLILDYDGDAFQSMGARGFDPFGLASFRKHIRQTCEILMPEGCSYLIRRDLFQTIGGFDPAFFMYGDEMDLSWRVWISGHKAIAVPTARLHHRGAANVNPAGGASMTEHRTSDTKRFLSSRNSLLIVLKNAQHVLFVLALAQLALTVLESIVVALVIRRWSFLQRNLLDSVIGCWQMRMHVRQCRERICHFRTRGDWFMLRFLDWRLNRWGEVIRVWRSGWPTVTPK